MAQPVDEIRRGLDAAGGVAGGVLPVVGGVVAGATTLAVAIAVAEYLYKEWKKPVPYDGYDLDRYHQLVACYSRHFTTTVPATWALNEARAPKFKENLLQSSIQLRSSLLEISTEHTSITESAMDMLGIISRLYYSLADRTVGQLREGNIEGLFFSELAIWIISELPLIPFKDKSGLDKLVKMKNYLEAVKISNVLIQANNSHDEGRNNPSQAVIEIIKNLDGIIDVSKSLIQSVGFTHHIEGLQEATLGMVTNALHMMYLLIEGEHAKEPNLSVVRFLAESPGDKIRAIKQKQLGKWLERFFVVNKITRSDFIGSQAPTLEQADTFLEGEVVGDLVNRLEEKLLNPMHNDWGLWPFLVRTSNKKHENLAHAQDMIKSMRQVFREIFNVLYAHALQSNANQASPVFGESWMYGDKKGSHTIEGLMLISNNAIDRLHAILQKLWVTDCASTFARARVKMKPDSDASVALISAGSHYQVFEKLYTTAKEKIGEINSGRRLYPERLIRAQQNIGSLMSGVLNYYQYHGLPNPELISTLTAALSPPGVVPAIQGAPATAALGAAATVAPLGVEATTAPLGAQTTVAPLGAPVAGTRTILKSSLLGYQATSALIGLDRRGGVTSLPQLQGAVLEPFRLMRRPTTDQFLSPMQRHIFTHFLERNERWLTIPQSLHITWLFWEKWQKFRALYLRVHAVYERLYLPVVQDLRGIELQLVDELLSSAMSYYYRLYNDARMSVYEYPIVNRDVIVQDGQEVGTCVVHIAEHLLSYANRSLIEKSTVLQGMHDTAVLERDRLRGEAATKDEIITTQGSELAAFRTRARDAELRAAGRSGVGRFFGQPRAAQNDGGAAAAATPPPATGAP